MYRVNASYRFAIVGLTAALTFLAISTDTADARRRHHSHGSSHASRHHAVSSSRWSPPYSSIVVDANTGRVMQETSPDAPRHPASLTKIMTLYLLFERLEAGKISLTTPLQVSAHAAAQPPSKLGLRPGQSIEVEDAIKAIVTRSANDIAVTVAENLGGSESDFAAEMTRKAHALGMSRTTYRNASGLPNDEQITTARDQAALGMAIQERFPRYYRYFSTTSFRFRNQIIRSHNHLLGQVEGVDGIKTGYINESGFNLVTSLRRGNRFMVSVIFGGTSARSRDARMRGLVEEYIADASTKRTSHRVEVAQADDEAAPAPPPAKPVLAAAISQLREAIPMPRAAIRTASASAAVDQGLAAAAIARPRPGSTDPLKPHLVKTVDVRRRTPAKPAEPNYSGSLRSPPGAAPGVLGVLRVQVASADPTMAPRAAAFNASQSAEPDPASRRSAHDRSRSGWIVQVGAFQQEGEAKQHLNAAMGKASRLLAAAEAFTERFDKGAKTYYRARFAGLNKDQAEAACKYLKRNDFACMVAKN